MEVEQLNPHQFDLFRDFIYRQSGIRIDDKKVTLLTNRVRRRVKAGEFDSFDQYYQFLTSPAGSGELENFLDAVTTNETFFFRTVKHFDWLKTDLIPEITAQHRSGQRAASLRILSAGCAVGAEPYSIAICLAENRYRLRDWSLEVVGVDISEEALQSARSGDFMQRAMEPVCERQRRRYFQQQPESDTWRVRPEIRELVQFKRHNLMQPLPDKSFDCIFIRNVLIYFDRASKQVVLKHLLASLDGGGYLVVGPSEGVFDMLSPLNRLSPFLYQKPDSPSPPDSDSARQKQR